MGRLMPLPIKMPLKTIMADTHAAREVPNPCAEVLLCALQSAYILAMLRKQLVIPPEAAKAFVRDMRAFFKARSRLKQDKIAARQCFALEKYVPRGTKLRLSNVKEMFLNLKDRV